MMPVCIIGMHRSGTSMVANLLRRCGLYLGNEGDLIPATADNLDGHWEHVKFVEINDGILNELGGGWDHPPSVPEGWNDERLLYLKAKAEALLQEFSSAEPWGWKDPRSSLTLPLWTSLLPEIKVVICLRNPLEVAVSMRRRGLSSYSLSLLLWKTYNQRILESVPPQNRIITRYENYFSDPKKELGRVLRFLNIPATEEAINIACGVTKNDLRHSRFTIQDMLDAGLSAEIFNLYLQMCQEAGLFHDRGISGPKSMSGSDADSEFMRQLQENNEAHELSIAPSEEGKNEGATQKRLLNESIFKLLLQRQELYDLRNALAARDTTIHDLKTQLSNTKQHCESLQSRISKDDAAIQDLQGELRKSQSDLHEADQKSITLQGDIALRDATIDDLKNQIHVISQETNKLQIQAAGSEAANGKLRHECDTLRQTVDAQESRLETLIGAVERISHSRDTLKSAILDVRDQVLQSDENIRSSMNELNKYVRYQALIHKIREVVSAVLPEDAGIIVITRGDSELLNLGGRRACHFPQTEAGDYAGYHPADSVEAIVHLETLRSKGSGFLLIPQTAFWWLDHYADLRKYLESLYQVVFQSDVCLIFDLRKSSVTSSLNGRSKKKIIKKALGQNLSALSVRSRSNSLQYRDLKDVIRQTVSTSLPAGATVIVVNKGDEELLRLDDRTAWHFPQIDDGRYAGHYPADSATAIAHLEALRAKGGDFFLLPSTAFWWLEHYSDFRQHLDARYQCVHSDQHCIIYHLLEPGPGTVAVRWLKQLWRRSMGAKVKEMPLLPAQNPASSDEGERAPSLNSDAETCVSMQSAQDPGNLNGGDCTPSLNGHAGPYMSMLTTSLGKAGSQYVPLAEEDYLAQQSAVKTIAFYLPQFHPIPENDAWWGKGFTEWTNVSKAVPQFEGHYQPHLPGELGFYDLRVPEVQQRQAELAKKYGVYGFCFHYYWFNGKRLLERPLDQFVSNPAIDFPFCICWANENWTRRWDGLENDVLISQVHSEESDLAFIKDVEPLLRHERYIKIDGRPLIVIYRVQLLPNPASTVQRWKEYCKEAGINEPYFVAAQTFGFADPREVGFDAAVEFPPHNIVVEGPAQNVKLFNPEYEGKIYSYQDLARKMQDYNAGKPYKVFKTVSPGWDNEPRKPGRGSVYAFSSPALYQEWLESSCNFVAQRPNPDERLVFINAWNEWGEGAHLEPDREYGYAYLEATKQALKNFPRRRFKVSVIVPNYNHEAFIERRLNSIINQSIKPDEIIFLDDASTDGSLVLAEEILRGSDIKYRIIPNEVNSGSVFKQWLKGLEHAEGDLIWIAESDDEADTDFLKNIMPQFERDDVLIAYGDISYINSDSSKNSGLENYYHELCTTRWKSSHVRTAHKLFSGDFAVKNIIPNVSGAVFRKPVLTEDEVERLVSYRFAGDWYFYALISRGGSISFCKEAKSYFRLNQGSTSRQAFFTQKHVDEHGMILEDLRALYGISEEVVGRHTKELLRILNLNGTAGRENGNGPLPKSIRPANVSDKLKICVASYGFRIGGGELVPIILANALRRLGHHITFLVMEANLPGDESPLRPKLRPDIPVLKWEDCESRFESVVKEFGFDVINSHNVAVEYSLFRQRIQPGVPYVASLHGGYETVPDLLTQDFISYLSRTVDMWLYLAEKNIALLVSNGLKNARFDKIFNAAITDSHKTNPDSGVRDGLRLPEDSVVLVLASRAIKAKGWGIAIDVTRRLRSETGRDIRLVLIGDGEDLQAIKESATDAPYVHFTGRLEDVGGIIHDCDFGIFPSTYEGESFPLFILECFAAGLPVITTDVGAIREMMLTEAGEVAGSLISPGQERELIVREMADALGEMLCDQESLDAARVHARERADHYSINKLVDKYLEIFDSISVREKDDLPRSEYIIQSR
jgi:glycosyltransferase involved in cell wall biosynthesis